MTADNASWRSGPEPSPPPGSGGGAHEDAQVGSPARRAVDDAEAKTPGAKPEALARELARQRMAQAVEALALSDARRAEGAARRDLAQAQAEVAGLRLRLEEVLGSTSWRVMGPMRWAVRALRGLDAPPDPAASPGASGRGAASLAGRAEEVHRLAGRMAIRELLALDADLGARPDDPAAFFLSRLARMLAHSLYSAHDEVVAGVEALRERLGADLRWVEREAGRSTFVGLTSLAASALTRVGRRDEAQSLLAAALADEPARPELLILRAQMGWPHDPAQARADLAACARRRALPGRWSVLRAHLEQQAGAPPPDPPAGSEGADAGQVGLVRALACLARGDAAGYRARFNAFFERQGLLPPLPARPPGAAPFAFSALQGPPGAPPALSPGASRPGAAPRVSVIMTTFNSAATVGYAAASILAQTHADLELLVVDDCSSDETRSRLAELAAADPRVRLMPNRANLGTYLAKNRAMEQATGAFVTFHDSDDWAHPERLARHLRLMEERPDLMASQSEWVRVDEDGQVRLHRWTGRFQHVNPASAFLRREAMAEVGYFDGVRFGADSEYWQRLCARYGRDRVATLPLCLGLGASHAASLTRSGDGALGPENYSPIRGAYAASYLRWHATAPPEALWRPASPGRRAFPAPPQMRPDAAAGPDPGPSPGREVPLVLFGISLAARSASGDWPRATELLGHTLRSVLAQGDGRFAVAIGGHERPDLPEMDDPRVRFVASDRPPPRHPGGFREDQMRKRRLLGACLREEGGGYFFALDADDLVHRDVVAHVLAHDNRRGYLIERGYALDYASGALAPVPGAWSVPFDRLCGSAAAIHFAPDELPQDGDLDPDLCFNHFQHHASWPVVAEEWGRPLSPFPFAAGVYVLNHAQNLSFRLQRAGARSDAVVRAIAAHALGEGPAILRENFGLVAHGAATLDPQGDGRGVADAPAGA